MYLFPAMVESIRADMPFSYGAMGTISGFVQGGFMVCALAAGFMTLRFGAMPMILGSIGICALCLAGMAIVPNILIMGALLTILGGCAAAIWVPMVEVAHEILPARHQGKALGLMSSGTSYGVFINSLLLTGLLKSEGWRALWATTFVIVAILAIAGFVRLRHMGKQSSETPGLSVERPSIGVRLRSLPKGLTAAILFMMFLNGISCMPYQTYLSAYIQGEAGYSVETAALVWRVIGLVGMVSGFAIGSLADRITVRWGMFVTYAVLAVACHLVVAASGGHGITKLYVAAFAFGISFYAIFGLVPAYISQVFGAGGAALVFAFGNIALGLGGIVGNMLGGILKESMGSFDPIYMVMLAAAVLSAVLSVLMPSERSLFPGAQPANA